MASTVSSHLRQDKPGASRVQQQQKRGKAAVEQPPSLGAHGAAAVNDFDIADEERELRSFDLNSKFGPCIGLSRLERWERASKFGLQPPERVKDLLLRLGEDSEQNKCIWHGRS